MSDSVQPHRQQPTRFPRPWDSPGKNTGVGCHFLLQCMKVKSESEVAWSCPTLSDPMDCSPPGSSIHGIWGMQTSIPFFFLVLWTEWELLLTKPFVKDVQRLREIMNIWVYIYTHIYLFIDKYIHIYTHIYMIYTFIYMNIHIYMWIYAYIHNVYIYVIYI